MDTYDLRTPDSYAVHLANMGNARGVVATRDIHNEDGMLLVKKGFSIKADTVKRLLNHKLVQPLETSVSIDNAIDADRLFNDILAVLHADAESRDIHQHFGLDELLRRHCERFAQYPLLSQKMTVLASRLKDEYIKALFCGWFCLAMAHRMGGDDKAIADAFFAGLVHDTGLLHIDPQIVEKQGEFTPEEWRAMQSHSLIADMFLSYVDGLSNDVRRAVREHHERSDGTGYPAALFGDQLGTLGQVVAMADIVWATSKKPAGRKVQSLGEVMTLVKMNTAQYPADVASALYHLRLGSEASQARQATTPHSADALGDQLVKLERQLRQRFRAADQLRGVLPATQMDRVMRSAHFKLERLWFVVNGSGLLSDSITDWLQQVKHKGEEAAIQEMHEMGLMYGELQWQLAQLGRTLELLLNRPAVLAGPLRASVETVVAILKQPSDVPAIQPTTQATPLQVGVA